MAIIDRFTAAWPRTAVRLLGAGTAPIRRGRVRHLPHDGWMLLFLRHGTVSGQDRDRTWKGTAPCTWLLPPAHPANEDFGEDGEVGLVTVLFDAVTMPGWSNPLECLPLPQVVACSDPVATAALMARLVAPCRDWQVVDHVAAVQARPDLDRLLLDHVADGLASGVFAESEEGRRGSYLQSVLGELRRRCMDQDLTLTEMVRTAGMSASGFSHACRRGTGLPPLAWLRRERMRLAVRLLRSQPEDAVREIAWRCGYRSLPLFCRHLRQATGMTARDIRATGQEVGQAGDRESADPTRPAPP